MSIPWKRDASFLLLRPKPLTRPIPLSLLFRASPELSMIRDLLSTPPLRNLGSETTDMIYRATCSAMTFPAEEPKAPFLNAPSTGDSLMCPSNIAIPTGRPPTQGLTYDEDIRPDAEPLVRERAASLAEAGVALIHADHQIGKVPPESLRKES